MQRRAMTEASVDAPPLAVGQPACVTRAGEWVKDWAEIWAINSDGTFDVVVKPHDVGALEFKCPHCSALLLMNEKMVQT